MAFVEISEKLKFEVIRKFKGESEKVFKSLKSLENNPKKGKLLASVGGVLIKELKYRSFRFYFIADGSKLRFLDEDLLRSLVIRFVRMSDKKSQQKVIEEIKSVLRSLGEEGF